MTKEYTFEIAEDGRIVLVTYIRSYNRTSNQYERKKIATSTDVDLMNKLLNDRTLDFDKARYHISNFKKKEDVLRIYSEHGHALLFRNTFDLMKHPGLKQFIQGSNPLYKMINKTRKEKEKKLRVNRMRATGALSIAMFLGFSGMGMLSSPAKGETPDTPPAVTSEVDSSIIEEPTDTYSFNDDSSVVQEDISSDVSEIEDLKELTEIEILQNSIQELYGETVSTEDLSFFCKHIFIYPRTSS